MDLHDDLLGLLQDGAPSELSQATPASQQSAALPDRPWLPIAKKRKWFYNYDIWLTWDWNNFYKCECSRRPVPEGARFWWQGDGHLAQGDGHLAQGDEHLADEVAAFHARLARYAGTTFYPAAVQELPGYPPDDFSVL